MKKQMVILSILTAMFGSQCSRTVVDPTEKRINENLNILDKRAVEGGNSFSLQLFKKINEAQPSDNIFISPLSVSIALGMTLNGAGGGTFEAMRSSLYLDGLTSQQINESYRALIELLFLLDPKVTFDLANSIWYRQGFSVESEFIDASQQYFNAAIEELDFNNPGATDIINNWVDASTNGKIDRIIDAISSETVMFLINALYFDASWTYEFDKNKTHEDQFNKPDGSTVPVQMMVLEADLNYMENEQFQAVELSYGDGDFSMLVILPKPQETIETTASSLNDATLVEVENSLVEKPRTLYMPKFKMEYSLELKDVLSDLGMGIAFDRNNADFGRINPEMQLFISRVLHKTFVDVNEEGTEAAAVTSVEIGVTRRGANFVLRIDHPFLFLIKENQTGSIVFMGKIVEPTDN